MFRKSLLLFAFFILAVLQIANSNAQVHKNNIAVCGASKGVSYYAYRNIAEGDILGWSEEENLTGSITFKSYDDGKLDLLFTDATMGSYSTLEEGGTLIPVSISDTAVSVVAIYPNKLSEAYVFQKLKNGKFEVIWTQTKSDTPLPKIAAWVGSCSYLNLELLEKK